MQGGIGGRGAGQEGGSRRIKDGERDEAEAGSHPASGRVRGGVAHPGDRRGTRVW